LSIAQYLIDSLGVVITIAVPVAFGAAILGFFYGLAIYVFNSGNEASKEKGVMIMKWGLVALFVMVSILGILRFMYNDAGFGGVRSFGIPILPQGSSGTR